MKIITTKRKFLIGAIFVLLSILGRDNLMAQTVTITGKITSEQDGLGVSGASILPPNTLYTLKIIVSGIKELAIIEYDNPGNK